MKKLTTLGIAASIAISGLYAADTSTNAPQTSGEITNYQAVLNIALAHKNEIFLSKINTLFNYVTKYILKTGDINADSAKIKNYFGLKDDLFKNFDGKNDIKIVVDRTGVYFENLYDSTPSEEELYFLQNAPNYPELMKLYKDSNEKYLLYMPFGPKTANFINVSDALGKNTLVVPDKYRDIIKDSVISETPPSVGGGTGGTAPSPSETGWIKPNGDGTFSFYIYNDKNKKWEQTAVIENDGTIRPTSPSSIGYTVDTKVSADNQYAINPQDVENKIVVKNLSEVDLNKIANGTIVVVTPDTQDKDAVTATYIKVGNTLQPLSKNDFTKETQELQEEMTKNFLNKYSSIYVTFDKDNFDKASNSFIPKGNFWAGKFQAKGVTFRKDPITGKEFAFLSGGADSYIRGTEAVKVFGYIQQAEKDPYGATFTIIVPFRNATPDIKVMSNGKEVPLYDQKVRQVPFGVSGYGIGYYYAYGNMCYSCVGGDYKYMGRVMIHYGSSFTGHPIAISKDTHWNIAVWEYKSSGSPFGKTLVVGPGFISFALYRVNDDGSLEKVYYHKTTDYHSFANIKGKDSYDPNKDYLAFGGGMDIMGSYDGTGGSFDVYSPGIIKSGRNAGFRGWIGGITIIPGILDDVQIKNIVKYQIPNLIKE